MWQVEGSSRAHDGCLMDGVQLHQNEILLFDFYFIWQLFDLLFQLINCKCNKNSIIQILFHLQDEFF